MSQLEEGSSRRPHGGCAILSRYALVLDTVAQVPGGLSLSEIGQRTQLPQATIYRLVHALVHVGFLAVGERRRRYVLGPRLLRLTPGDIPSSTVSVLAQPILNQLATDFGETAVIAKLEGAGVATLGVAMPGGALPAFIRPGHLLPLHAAASAKAILAFSSDSLIGDFLRKPRPCFTSRTKTERTEIADELARIREQGFAVCNQELDAGVLAYACPVRNGTAAVTYSLGLVGYAERLGRAPPDAVVSSLKVAARVFSNVLREECGAVPDPWSSFSAGLPFAQRDDRAAIDH